MGHNLQTFGIANQHDHLAECGCLKNSMSTIHVVALFEGNAVCFRLEPIVFNSAPSILAENTK